MLAPHPDPAPRSITTPPPVLPQRLHQGLPILEPRPAHAWESRVVLNPAGVLVEAGAELEALFAAWDLPEPERRTLRAAGGACVLLYRAQGVVELAKGTAPSYLGLAAFTPDLRPVWRRAEPVLRPDAPFHNLGVEDPRCTNVGDVYYLYYTGLAGEPPDQGERRRMHICLATTRDFLAWELHGPLEGDVNAVANKNAALLPRPVADRWILLHRPMAGPGAMAIHYAVADHPRGPWQPAGLLMASHAYAEFARSWIGAGGPPLPLGDERFLMIYHQGHFTATGQREYDLAAALLDFSGEQPVRSRIEPLMRPTGAAERQGDAALGVDNVLFSCANYFWQDRLVVPYAGADSRIFGAALASEALVAALDAHTTGRSRNAA